jgi:hypothetical protein
LFIVLINAERNRDENNADESGLVD